MSRITINRIKDKSFSILGMVVTILGLLLLVFFIADIVIKGISRIDWNFLTALPSYKAEKAGIYIAMLGTISLLFLTTIISLPIGIGAAIYLEEYTKKDRLSRILEINISNLAGVPSIIYGLLGLEIFARVMTMGTSVLAGSMTLSLLILPIIIVATRESIKAVPQSIRDASYALGASKWQTIFFQVLPASFGGILTGVILALSRAIGEAAPLIVVGALMYIADPPSSPMEEYTVLPIQIFNWISRPQHEFTVNAAAAIIILLIITFSMNGIAIYMRNRWMKRQNW